MGKVVVLNYGLTFDRPVGQILSMPDERSAFIRLPETYMNEGEPADPRSDITSLAGVAYFALTGKDPGELVDINGKMPHLRDGDSFYSLFNGDDQVVIAKTFFDQAFARQLDDRFQSVGELVSAWRGMSETKPTTKKESSFLDVVFDATERLERENKLIQLDRFQPGAERVVTAIRERTERLAKRVSESAFRIELPSDDGVAEPESDANVLASVRLRLCIEVFPDIRHDVQYRVSAKDSKCVLIRNAIPDVGVGQSSDLVEVDGWTGTDERPDIDPAIEDLDGVLSEVVALLERRASNES